MKIRIFYFAFAFVMETQINSKFPQVFFRICFRSYHVGHTQATTAGYTYEIN